MLRIAKLADYATAVMTHLARRPGELVTARELSAATGVALPTVSKVLKALAHAGLVCSTRGVRGGYLLSRPPAEISLAAIIGAIEGSVIGVTECLSAPPGTCEQEGVCSVRGNWHRVNLAIRAALEAVSLAEFAAPPQAIPKVEFLTRAEAHRGARR